MSNRATVFFTEKHDVGSGFSPGVYLHWNGGPESIYAFLTEFKRRGYGHDMDYDAARFTQIVGEFFDSEYFTGLSLGVVNGPCSYAALAEYVTHSDLDNGAYIVSGGEVVARCVKLRDGSALHSTSTQIANETRQVKKSERYVKMITFLAGLHPNKLTEARHRQSRAAASFTENENVPTHREAADALVAEVEYALSGAVRLSKERRAALADVLAAFKKTL